MSAGGRGLLPLAALLLLGGCAAQMSDQAEERDGGQAPGLEGEVLALEESGDEPGEDADMPPADDAPDPRPPQPTPDAPPADTASDPYAERSGTHDEREPEAPPSRVTFRAPSPRPEPLARDMRPELPERARLAVISVRDGEIEHLPAVVLGLQTLLHKETEIKAVLNLGAPRLARVGLLELSAQAKAEGRDLLLVDVRPGPPGVKRTGYLLHTGDGALLARYDVPEDPQGVDVSEGADADLCARLGAAYARARD